MYFVDHIFVLVDVRLLFFSFLMSSGPVHQHQSSNLFLFYFSLSLATYVSVCVSIYENKIIVSPFSYYELSSE